MAATRGTLKHGDEDAEAHARAHARERKREKNFYGDHCPFGSGCISSPA